MTSPGPSAPIRIGVAIADMSEFEAIDPAYGIGDQVSQVEALVAAEQAREDVPAPPPFELVVRSFSSTSIEHKRAVADELAAAGVLAVIGARDFTYGSVRLAEHHRVPVLDVNAVPRTVFRRTDPWLFTVRTAQDIVYWNYAGWAVASGALEGRRIGVFSDRFTATSTALALTRLAEHGHVPAVHVESDGVGVGSDHDADAAERFAAAGVDLVMPFVSGSSLANVLRRCEELDHLPRVLDLETGEHATDVSGSVMPPAIYEGTRALVMSRVGEVAAGRPLDALAERAVSVVEAATGTDIERSGRDSSGALSNILLVHDLVTLLLDALRTTGPPAERPALIAALEQIRDRPSATGGRISFGPGEHWGCRELREVQWTRGAWRVVSDYRPLDPPPSD